MNAPGTTNWQRKLIQILLLLVGTVIASRIVLSILGPLLPSLISALVIVGLLMWVIRGPHGGGLFKG